MILVSVVIALILALVAVIFYYKHTTIELKNKVAAKALENEVLDYVKDAYKSSNDIKQTNSNLPAGDIRDRMRTKGYTRKN